MTSLLIIAMAAGAASVSTPEPANWPKASITGFNNPEGAKEWTANCAALIDPAKRTGNIAPNQIGLARRSEDGCVYFEANGQQFWVKEGAVTLGETKTTNKNACAVYAQANGSGATVEAATMGAGQTGSKASCK